MPLLSLLPLRDISPLTGSHISPSWPLSRGQRRLGVRAYLIRSLLGSLAQCLPLTSLLPTTWGWEGGRLSLGFHSLSLPASFKLFSLPHYHLPRHTVIPDGAAFLRWNTSLGNSSLGKGEPHHQRLGRGGWNHKEAWHHWEGEKLLSPSLQQYFLQPYT